MKARGSGPRPASQAVLFPRDVVVAVAGLTGYSVSFSNEEDHELGQLAIGLETQIQANLVTVDVQYGLRDWSGDWDDDYEGLIEFAVVAELVPATPGPTRDDLFITGMELNQVIQHFRSSQHLDAANARPDNSIPLIAEKDTGVRVYVDYDAGSGLPVITTLSGELELRPTTGSATTIVPNGTIAPQRDSLIERGDPRQTLNFTIPEDICRGDVLARSVVFDANAPDQRSSSEQRTLRFRDVEPLRVLGVGVHYTGQDLDLPAPDAGDLLDTLPFTELMYPVPEIEITDFTEIEFSEDLKADIEDGCGDGFSALLDDLEDLKGDSSDVVFAILPTGDSSGSIDSGTVNGCGRHTGVAATFATSQGGAAHEIGHGLGRKHAPCDLWNRCHDPHNQDDDYPKYDDYASDSIGEFGFEPLASLDESVKDPQDFHDFMGYSGHNWISPYTYRGLMGHFGTFAALARRSATESTNRLEDRPHLIRKKTMRLFPRVIVDHDGKASLRPSFHFPAFPTDPAPGIRTHYRIELLDDRRRPLVCTRLYNPNPDCARCCTKRLWASIPFDPAARWFVVRTDGEPILEQHIPDPPQVRIVREAYQEDTRGVLIEWSSEPLSRGLWYLVQWEDPDGNWKGVAPRTRETTMVIPRRLFGKRRTMRVRVLATSGLATGSVERKLRLPDPNPEEVAIVLSGVLGPRRARRVRLGPIVRATAFLRGGGSARRAEFVWFDEAGSELGRGKRFDLRRLEQGRHLIRVVAPNQGAGAGEAAWMVERKGDEFWMETAGEPYSTDDGREETDGDSDGPR